MSTSPSHNESSGSAESSKRTADAIDDSLERKESEPKRLKTESTNPSAPAALPGNNISVFVRLLSGRKLRIEVNTDDEIESFISKIVSMTSIGVSEYTLFYEGKPLNPVNKIEEWGIERDSIIHLVETRVSRQASEIWSALQRMVNASIQMCEVGYDSELEIDIRRDMENFLKEVKKDSDELGEQYLAMFRSLSCEDALVGLHLSPVKQNADLGGDVILRFFDMAEEVEPRLQACAAISVLQFCNCLRMKNTRSEYYFNCRNKLSYIVTEVFQNCLGNEDTSLVTWEEITPYMFETGEKIKDELAVILESPDTGTPTFKDVKEFYAFLNPVVRCISGNESEPIRMQDGALSQISEHLQPLFDLFQQLIFSADRCFVRAENDLSRKGGDSVLDAVDKSYFLLIKALSDISKIFDRAFDSMLKLLDERKILLRAILTRNEILTYDDFGFLDWLLELTQVLDFKCRKHISRILFPLLSEDPGDQVLIERSELVVQSYMYISQAEPDKLQYGFHIKFKHEEATGHGVMREWILLLCRQIFTPQNPMFIFNQIDQRRFYINPASEFIKMHLAASLPLVGHLDYFKFCGRLIGLALLYDVQIGVLFDNVMYLRLAEPTLDVQLEDIKDTDIATYQSLQKILTMDAALVDSGVLELTFTFEYDKAGEKQVVELCDGGADMKVTSQNREEYVKKMIRQQFQVSTWKQIASFSKGFAEILLLETYFPTFFRYVALEDLDLLLAGSGDSEIFVEDWKAHTNYTNYTDSDPQIIWFWKAVEEMSAEERRNLLYFWVAIKYLPSDGFSGINSGLQISKAVGISSDQLPSSHTCVHMISLPEYPTYEILKQRLAVVAQEFVASSFGNL